MGKKHQDGAKTSKHPDQTAGRHRGVETGNGWTASTGRGKPDKVTFRGAAPENAGRRSVLRTIADVMKPKPKGGRR